MIGLRSFPSALVMCATAWESVLKAKLSVDPEDRVTLRDLLTEIRLNSAALRAVDSVELDAFRKTRNRLVHYGFSPKDDEECARLLLDVGLPFLGQCYIDLFDFFLDWREIRPGNTEFQNLTPAEMEKAGLLLEVAEQLHFGAETYRRASQHAGLEVRYCFHALSHYIRLGLKELAMTSAEWKVLDRAESDGEKWEHHRKLKADIERQLGGATWEFNCPVCGQVQCFVADLDEHRLDAGEIRAGRGACVQCGFIVGEGAPYLLEILLAKQYAEAKPKILQEFGIKQ
jgi:hypothetical protein